MAQPRRRPPVAMALRRRAQPRRRPPVAMPCSAAPRRMGIGEEDERRRWRVERRRWMAQAAADGAGGGGWRGAGGWCKRRR
nr:unnamed protein product [Digitaria exilis]